MKLILKLAVSIVLTSIFFYISCQKELSCENCIENSPPIANAGKDTAIILPVDSINLDGRLSTDLDGIITSYKWTKISGPVSSDINEADSSKTSVRTLVIGVYTFELSVTDNGGLSANDTVQIIVNGTAQSNQPPIANAGADQTTTLSTDTVNLDGSASTDPDNNISNYSWTKISGPSSFNIANPNSAQTHITNLVQGTYQFELKVTDADGLFSKDTIQVTVIAQPCAQPSIPTACDNSIRPQICAQLIPVSTLSQTREGMAIASAANKILFAGGYTGNYSSGQMYSRVDIFDVTTNSWTTAELSQARTGIATAVLNNRIYFAGGEFFGGASSRVDIYDAVANTWASAELSHARSLLAGAAAGNKVLFAGGYGMASSAPAVDIYDASTNAWSTDSLRNRPTTGIIGDAGIAATVVGNKVYFAGNASDWYGFDFGSISATINIYDATANTWSTSALSETRGGMAAIAVGSKNYWAGGVNGRGGSWTNLVEIRDMNSGISTFSCLFHSDAFFSAVQKNNKIVFFTSYYGSGNSVPLNGRDKFDVYDIPTNTWSIGVLPVNIYGSSIISVNNTVYVAGGLVNGVLSNQVWKLEF